MNRLAPLAQLRPLALGVSAALAFALACDARAASAPQPVRIVVQQERFVMDGRPHASLDALQKAVRARAAKAIELQACAPGSTRLLLASAHRLRHLPLELQVLMPGEPGCPQAQEAGLQRVGYAAPGREARTDAAVERYWRSLQP